MKTSNFLIKVQLLHIDDQNICGIIKFNCRLKDEKSSLVTDKDKLQGKLERYMIYQKYMEKVLEAGDEFHEMRDIIARHDTLVATHEVMFNF